MMQFIAGRYLATAKDDTVAILRLTSLHLEVARYSTQSWYSKARVGFGGR